jgi:hypothetical protein
MSSDYSVRGYGAPPRRKRRGLELLFVLGFAASLLVGVAALGALWLLSGRNAPAATGPRALLQPEQVQPALATRNLAGDPSGALVAQALQAGELPTAAALLLFDTESTHSARAALWQQLGRRWLNANEGERAAVAYAQTVSIGALDVALRSLERAQLLTQAAAGLQAAELPDQAQAAATQAVRAIAQSPDLLPAQRSQLLQGIKPVVDTLDAPELAAQVNDLARNPFVDASGILLTNSWPLITTLPPGNVAVEEAADARMLAARNLADRYVLTGGVDVQPEIDALRAALLDEDQQRGAAGRAALAVAPTREAQLGLLLAQRAWLLRKLQVASGAFGLSIVPEWEAGRAALESEYSGLMANIQLLVQAIADMQPTALEQNMLRAEVAEWAALDHELGLYPGANVGEINDRLRAAQAELEGIGSALALPVLLEPENALPGFRIQAR